MQQVEAHSLNEWSFNQRSARELESGGATGNEEAMSGMQVYHTTSGSPQASDLRWKGLRY